MNGKTLNRMRIFCSLGTPHYHSIKWKMFGYEVNSSSLQLCMSNVFKSYVST